MASSEEDDGSTPIPIDKDSALGNIPISTGRGSKVQLREIEGEVHVNGILRKKSFNICRPWMDAFVECSQLRLLSVAWACRVQKDQMQLCLERAQARPELIEESLNEYLRIRAKFQEYYKKTGNSIMPKELRD